MKEKNLPQDYDRNSLEELTEKVNRIIKALENEKNLNNSVERYQDLIKLNNIIEKKFQKSFKLISKNTNSKIKEISISKMLIKEIEEPKTIETGTNINSAKK